MSVASHLRIGIAEYDRRIRTFIPHYPEMLAAAASTAGLLPGRRPTILDLGIGTGALAARCLRIAPHARLHGLDADPEMLAVAARRLRASGHPACTLTVGSFLTQPLPRCDLIAAALAFHHVSSRQAKRRLYRRCFEALRARGLLVTADCFPPSVPALARRARTDWTRHMERRYTPAEAQAYLAAWAREDTYVPLAQEIEMLRAVGFQTDVIWRRGAFGVLVGWRT